MRLFDAHNHLQDERLKPRLDEIVAEAQQQGIEKMVVNGSCEADWNDVLKLAKRYPKLVIPSFGFHPWYVSERTDAWRDTLLTMLDAGPAGVGEIGLDKWILERQQQRAGNHEAGDGPEKGRATTSRRTADLEEQEEVFTCQLRLAAQRNSPASIHCLQAWGRLLEILKREPKPKCGFVLHSFGGPKEMIAELNELGAYFSLPGYFAHERKSRQRDAFQRVPLERLLIETDAPDQSLPGKRVRFPLNDNEGKPINHPANLTKVYEFGAEVTGLELESLTHIVEGNFNRIFGHLRD